MTLITTRILLNLQGQEDDCTGGTKTPPLYLAHQDLQSSSANIFMLPPDLWQLLLESSSTESQQQLGNLSNASLKTTTAKQRRFFQ